MKPDVRVFADVNELSLRAAAAAVMTISESVQTNGVGAGDYEKTLRTYFSEG
jgi:hypothetical protein